MADHLILGEDALGELYISPLVSEEYDNTYWITWTKPDSQERVAPDTKFIVKFNRPIDMTVLSLSNFRLDRVLQASPLQIEEVTDAFEDLDLVYSYDSIARELTLTLVANLSTNADYFFSILDLQDTAGGIQNVDHVVFFTTTGTGTQYDITQPDIDTIIVEDYALVGPPVLNVGSNTSVTCSILDGSLNVTEDDFTLTYGEAVDVDDIVVTEENLDTGTILLLTCTKVQDPDSYVVAVTLPYAAKENCLYTVSAIYSSFQFIGALSPFLVPLSDLAIYTSAPAADPITWARMVYIYSKEVAALLGDDYDTAVTDKPEALKNYTKYLVLSMFASYASNESFMLGELQISSGQRTGGLLGGLDYATLLDQWQKELFGGGHPTKTVDVLLPRANSYNRASGKYKKQLEREAGTFDKRMF